MKTQISPWQFVSRKLTGWLLPHLDYTLMPAGEPCGCCKAPPETWPSKSMAVQYTDSYGRDMAICEDCLPLYVSRADLMGVERLARGNPVPQKFGMLASVKVVADQRSVVMFVPQKIAEKLPKSFPVAYQTYASLAEANRLILTTEWEYPIVVIADLGKKKGEMIENLRYSYSPRKVFLSTAEHTDIVNITAVNECIELARGLDKKIRNVAIKAMRDMASGKVSPADLASVVNENPEIRGLMRASTPDPALRQIIAKVIADV